MNEINELAMNETEAKYVCIQGAIALSNLGVDLLERNHIAEAIETIIDSTVVFRHGLSAPMLSYLGVPAFLRNAESRAAHCLVRSNRITPVRAVSFADPKILSLFCEHSGMFYPIRINDALGDPGLLSAILFYNLGIAYLCDSEEVSADRVEKRNQAIHFFQLAICVIHSDSIAADALTLWREKIVKLAILHSLLPSVCGGEPLEQLRLDLTAEFDELVRAVKEIGCLLSGSTGNYVALAAWRYIRRINHLNLNRWLSAK